jgi:hypothetical protein
MKKLIESVLNDKIYVTEMFDSHHEFQSDGNHGAIHKYSFNHDGHKYHVHIDHGTEGHEAKTAGVEFSRDDHDGKQKLGMTNDVKGAHRVVGTVHHVLLHHLKTHPNIKHVDFIANAEDRGRTRLYDKYTKAHGGQIRRRSTASIYKIDRDKLVKD